MSFFWNPGPVSFSTRTGPHENNPYYAHWQLGQVIDDVSHALGPALAIASETHAQFLPEQRAGFAYTFYEEPGSTAAQRGADAIADFLAAVVGAQQHVASFRL